MRDSLFYSTSDLRRAVPPCPHPSMISFFVFLFFVRYYTCAHCSYSHTRSNQFCKRTFGVVSSAYTCTSEGVLLSVVSCSGLFSPSRTCIVSERYYPLQVTQVRLSSPCVNSFHRSLSLSLRLTFCPPTSPLRIYNRRYI